jgi:hypothetical protein
MDGERGEGKKEERKEGRNGGKEKRKVGEGRTN